MPSVPSVAIRMRIDCDRNAPARILVFSRIFAVNMSLGHAAGFDDDRAFGAKHVLRRTCLFPVISYKGPEKGRAGLLGYVSISRCVEM